MPQLSANMADLTLDQLVMVQQGLGNEIDKLREARQRVAEHVKQRLLAGERLTGEVPTPAAGSGDATAPGAFIVVQAKA